MNLYTYVSDLSQSFSSLRHSRTIRAELDQKALELTTGQRSSQDIARTAETGRVAAIDRSLAFLDTIERAVEGANVRTSATQAALGSIRDGTRNLMLGVLSVTSTESSQTVEIQAREAIQELDSVVAALNTSVAGVSIFSGAATDQAAVTDAATILSDVEGILAAAPDVATALTTVDFYFNDPTGGYLSSTYTGSTDPGPDVTIGEGETVGFDIRADNDAVRETLRNVALVAAVANGAFAGTAEDNNAILTDAATGHLETSDALVRLQEGLGYVEERIQHAEARNEASRLRLQLSRNDIAAVDPYDAAARFEDLEAQVQRHYVVTSRLSDLSLVNFLR